MAGAGTLEQRAKAYLALVKAGATRDERVTFMRIASRESEFDTTAHNDVPPDDSYGLWQINTLGPLWDEVKSYGIVNDRMQLFSREANARVAVHMKRRYGWKPWNVGGNHLAGTLSEAEVMADIDPAKMETAAELDEPAWWEDVVTGATGTAADALDTVTNPLASVGRFFAALMNVGLWKRIGLGAAGVLLLGIGIMVWRGQAITARRRPAEADEVDEDEDVAGNDADDNDAAAASAAGVPAKK